METKGLLRTFARFAGNNVLAMVGMSCYILVDTFFIANVLGAPGLAALNFAIPIYSLMQSIGQWIGMGASTKYAIFRAQNLPTEANRVFTHATGLALATGAVFLVAGVFFAGPLSALVGASGEAAPMTETYLHVLLAFAPAFIMNATLVAFTRSDGAPNLAMVAMVAGSVTNIILDYLFLFPLQMGMFGAVLATGFSPVVGVCILSTRILRRKNHFRCTRCRVSFRTMGSVFATGFPAMIGEFSNAVVVLSFNRVILSLSGNTGVAAYGILTNVALIGVAIFNGIAQGVQPLLATYHGQRDKTSLRRTLRYTLLSILAAAAVLYCLTVVFRGPIIALFNNTRDLAMAALASSGLPIYFAAFFFIGFNIAVAALFSAVERPLRGFCISILRGCACILPCLFLLSALLGITGVWLAYPVAELLTAIVSIIFLLRWRRQSSAKGMRLAS